MDALSLRNFRLAVGLLVLLFSLAACSPSSTRNGRLIIWHTWDDESEAAIIDQILADFQRIHPDIQISVESKDFNTVLDEYASASRAGLGPDVLIGVEAVFAHVLYERGLISDLSGEGVNWNNFTPATLQAVQGNDGVRVGVPVNAYVSVLFFNPETIEQPPESFDDLIVASGEGLQVGLPTSFFASYWGITGLGGDLFDGDSLAAEGQDGLEAWLAWLTEFQQNPGAVLSSDERGLADGFARGDLDILVANSLELAPFVQQMGQENLRVATLPGTPDTRSFSNIELIVVNSASVQMEAATRLTNFMSNDAQQRKMARSISGRAPVNKNVTLNETLFPEVSLITQQYQSAVVPSTGQDDMLNILIPAANPVYQQVLEGLLTPSEGASQIYETALSQMEGR